MKVMFFCRVEIYERMQLHQEKNAIQKQPKVCTFRKVKKKTPKSLHSINIYDKKSYLFSGDTAENVAGNIYNDWKLVVRKPVFGVSDKVRHKPGCTTTEDV